MATRDDVTRALTWAADEGWNPGHDDASAFHAADPDGFFVATSDGVPVAAISVVNHTDDFAFLGLYLVRPAFRGQGIGLALWHHALKHAGNRTVGLDGVADQQDNYEKSGFSPVGTTTRYSGEITGQGYDDVRLATASDIETLINLEAHVSGVRKTRYMQAWLGPTETRKTWVTQGGFCTVRQCQVGAKIGPLVANNLDVAERLIEHAATTFGQPIVIDVPEPSAELAQLCQGRGLAPSFHTARMYRGPFTPAPPAIYAVATLELG